MGEISTVLVLGSLVAYTVALISFAVDISALGGHAPHRTVRRAANIAVAVSWLGFGMHAVGLVLRGLAAGRVPWANMYEFSLTFGIVAMGTFLVINRVRDIRYLGVFVSFLVVCVLTVAFWQLYVEADGVQPILDSYWLGIHVSVAAASTGLFSVAAAASALQLLQHRQERKVEARAAVAAPVPVAAGAVGTLETVELDTVDTAESVETSGAGSAGGTSPRRPSSFAGRLMAQLPGSESLERFAYRLNAVAFVGWTLTVVAGAIWAEAAWGRPWGWDPKETWSLVIWLVYAAYLHMRATVGWTINRFAWFALAGFVALMANFYVVNVFFAGRHSYSGL
ncbi:MAG TPA: c-type cytochrome biogenesis protein CcsB [Actinotalea caeni]|uniref:c-type cytochrome biogenesis protein CcsB n=1 Tax=Actinotalea caeni TaxID=1348467 RepID=UPI0012E3135D|nr:c-type cytochrome biogenesis protein CcsB [Actinotalea caeni]HLV56717.1 c-type cytochrome biogenesis protein CcsB [Actinotalea caeni]